MGELAAAVDDAAGLPHRVGSVARSQAEVGGDAADALARASRLFGELAHLVGNDREPTPSLTRTRRLDRRVERQQVGLFRNLRDRGDDAADLAGLRRQRHEIVLRTLQAGAELLDGVAGTRDQVAAKGHFFAARLRQRVGLGHVRHRLVDHREQFLRQAAGAPGCALQPLQLLDLGCGRRLRTLRSRLGVAQSRLQCRALRTLALELVLQRNQRLALLRTRPAAPGEPCRSEAQDCGG